MKVVYQTFFANVPFLCNNFWELIANGKKILLDYSYFRVSAGFISAALNA